MIENRRHVKDIHDAIHWAIQSYAKSNALEVLHGPDVVTALAWVLRDMIREAPDLQTRGQLAAGARYAIDDAARSQIVLPAGHV